MGEARDALPFVAAAVSQDARLVAAIAADSESVAQRYTKGGIIFEMATNVATARAPA